MGLLPRLTFWEGLVPDAESPFLKLADIEVTNNHTKRFGVAKAMQRNTPKSFTQVPQHQVGFEVDVDDHHDAPTSLVVTT